MSEKEQKLYKHYAFPKVRVKGKQLYIDEPWVLMERARATDGGPRRICDRQYGDRLNEWYAAMVRGDIDFETSLSGTGYLRLGAGASISWVRSDGRISFDGHERSNTARRRPLCLDIRAGVLDWEGAPGTQSPPDLVGTICKEVAEECIFWEGDTFYYVQFEDEPFRNHNDEVRTIQENRRDEFFKATNQTPPSQKGILWLQVVPPRRPVVAHWFDEKPFAAHFVDERDTSSGEIFVQFRHKAVDNMSMADCEKNSQGAFLHRRIMKVWPDNGALQVWERGNRLQGQPPTIGEQARRRQSAQGLLGNEKWAMIALEILCEIYPQIAELDPLSPEGAAMVRTLFPERPDIAAILDILRARRGEV